MSDAPAISVVMAAFNEAARIDAALESLLQQGESFEIVAVDDGSTDGTGRVLADYAARNSRVRVITRDHAGLTAALISGCDAARGIYIARQDADDISLPGRLRALRAALEADSRIVLATSWTAGVGPSGEVVHQRRLPPDPELLTRQLLHERVGPPGHGSVMFRRDAYERAGGYRAVFHFAQDADLWLRLADAGGLMCCVQQTLYRFRYRPEGISFAQRDIQTQFGELGQACHRARQAGVPETPFLEAAARLRQRFLAGEEPRESGSLAAAYYFIGSGLLSRRDTAALGYLARAVAGNPLSLRAWSKMAAAAFIRILPRASSGA